MHCTVAVTLLLLISSVSSTSDEVNGILKFLFKNSKYLPRDIKIPKSEKYPEIDLTTDELIQHYGYPAETHQVTTPDGYILTLQRIPNYNTTKPAVFFMHGLLASSACFLFSGPENSLPFLLAKQGYDVWFGNARGTTYSRKHISLEPDDDKSTFWDFSWHEIGVIDIPTSIDYILDVTQQQNVIYIGHSQGTTSFYALASERSEYNEKISLAVLLAPVGFMTHMPNTGLKLLAKNVKILEVIANAIEFYEVLPQMRILGVLAEELCGDDAQSQQKCIDIYNAIMGKHEQELNTSMIPIYLAHYPAGASVKQLYHYAQEINSGHFRLYDYGSTKNFKKYGTFIPPDYNLQNIITPVALYYAHNDDMTAEIDVEEISNELPNVIDKYLVEDEMFTHIDFLTAINVKKLLYDRIIALINKY